MTPAFSFSNWGFCHPCLFVLFNWIRHYGKHSCLYAYTCMHQYMWVHACTNTYTCVRMSTCIQWMKKHIFTSTCLVPWLSKAFVVVFFDCFISNFSTISSFLNIDHWLWYCFGKFQRLLVLASYWPCVTLNFFSGSGSL